jgi:hypothetical protein
MRSFKPYFSIVFERRRRGAVAFWMGLVWVAFLHQGWIVCRLSREKSQKIGNNREKSQKGQIFFFHLSFLFVVSLEIKKKPFHFEV